MAAALKVWPQDHLRTRAPTADLLSRKLGWGPAINFNRGMSVFWGGGKPERQEERLEAYRVYLIDRFGDSRLGVEWVGRH